MKKIIVMLCAVLFVLISAVFFERSYSAVQATKEQAPPVIVADAGQTPCKTKDDTCKTKTWMGKMTDKVKNKTKKIGNEIKKPFTTVGEKVKGVKNKTP